MKGFSNSNKMYYAGIGSRKTPSDIRKQMTDLAVELASRDYVLRSGGAIGADTAFENGAIEKQIFLGDEPAPMWTRLFTKHFHPSPKNLSSGGWKMMNRNALQILGWDGNTPVDFVICWTKDGKASGGTGQAIRIADYFSIPVYNLKTMNHQQILTQIDFIGGKFVDTTARY